MENELYKMENSYVYRKACSRTCYLIFLYVGPKMWFGGLEHFLYLDLVQVDKYLRTIFQTHHHH